MKPVVHLREILYEEADDGQKCAWRWLCQKLLKSAQQSYQHRTVPTLEMTKPSGVTVPEGLRDDSTFANQQRRANDASTKEKEQTDDTAGNLPTSSDTD